MKLSHIHENQLDEGLFGPSTAQILKKYPMLNKLVERAKKFNISLFDRGNTSWWSRLFKMFGVPKGEHGDVLSTIVGQIAPRIDKESEQIKQKGRGDRGRGGRVGGRRRGIGGIRDMLGGGGKTWAAGIERNEEPLLEVGRWSDYLSGTKRKQIKAAKNRSKNNERIAMAAVKLLADEFGMDGLDRAHDPAAEVDPTADPTTDPIVDPAVDPITDPAADPATDPAADPITDPAADPIVDPTDDPDFDKKIAARLQKLIDKEDVLKDNIETEAVNNLLEKLVRELEADQDKLTAKHAPYMKKLRDIIIEFRTDKLAAKGKKMPHKRMTSYVEQIMTLKRLLNAAVGSPTDPAADPITDPTTAPELEEPEAPVSSDPSDPDQVLAYNDLKSNAQQALQNMREATTEQEIYKLAATVNRQISDLANANKKRSGFLGRMRGEEPDSRLTDALDKMRDDFGAAVYQIVDNMGSGADPTDLTAPDPTAPEEDEPIEPAAPPESEPEAAPEEETEDLGQFWVLDKEFSRGSGHNKPIIRNGHTPDDSFGGRDRDKFTGPFTADQLKTEMPGKIMMNTSLWSDKTQDYTEAADAFGVEAWRRKPEAAPEAPGPEATAEIPKVGDLVAFWNNSSGETVIGKVARIGDKDGRVVVRQYTGRANQTDINVRPEDIMNWDEGLEKYHSEGGLSTSTDAWGRRQGFSRDHSDPVESVNIDGFSIIEDI